jgi:hypothetical protein
MSLEKRIASVAMTLFLPEFSFAANKFQIEKGEYELADHVVWVDNLLLAIQVKERKADLPEAQWFAKKVVGVATRQVRDTVRFLRLGSRLRRSIQLLMKS